MLNSISLWTTGCLLLWGGLVVALAQETERRVFVMGTWLDVSADSPATAEQAIREIEAVEASLSRWRAGSDIARMNAGEAVVPSPVVSNALARASHWQCWSEQAFHVRRQGRLDTDAFAKGAALDQALAALRQKREDHDTVMIRLNFGGQVAVFGQAPWSGQLSAPLERDHAAGHPLYLASGSLSTSGNAVKPGHIRDPATGAPILTRGHVTVWAPNAFDADCASTACFVLGPERALKKVNATADLECRFEWVEQQNGRDVVHRLVSENWRAKISTPPPKTQHTP